MKNEKKTYKTADGHYMLGNMNDIRYIIDTYGQEEHKYPTKASKLLAYIDTQEELFHECAKAVLALPVTSRTEERVAQLLFQTMHKRLIKEEREELKHGKKTKI